MISKTPSTNSNSRISPTIDPEQISQRLLTELSIDDIINEIGWGKFHIRVFLLHIFMSFLMSTQCAVPGAILPSLKREFNLSKSELSLFGSFEYLGFLISSLVLGMYSNKFGRRKCVLFSQIFWLTLFFLTLFAPNIYIFSILRFFVATGFMLMFVCSYSLLSEYCPQKSRGVVMNSMVFVTISAFMSAAGIAKLLIPDINNSDWRPFVIFFCILCLISLILNSFYLEESPRFDLFLGCHDRAIESINRMALLNRGIHNFMDLEKRQQLEFWVEKFNDHLHQTLEIEKKNHSFFGEFMKLFKGAYKEITISMFIVWSVISSNLLGMEFGLPFTLSKILGETEYNPFTVIFFINLAILPLVFPFILMGEMKYFGRRKTLKLAYAIMAISGVFVYLEFFPGPIFWLAALKMMVHLAFNMLYLFTLELYPTRLRTNALGQSSAVSRIGSIIIVWVSMFLIEVDALLPFLVYGMMALVAALVLWRLPHETLNEDLDRVINKS